MNAVVIEHIPVSELPAEWQERLNAPASSKVTVHIEEEVQSTDSGSDVTANPMFGMWRDRQDIADVEAFVRKLRAPRYK
jgi:hypothetical protein